MSVPTAYFERLYASDDPFGYRSRWYETRKRNLLLSALPQCRYARAWEFGCSNGELTARLADRCDSLLATDISTKAVELATATVRQRVNVRVEVAHHPQDWPAGRFDLIVFGEVGFYLDEATLAETARKLAQSLTSNGLLVGCHWLAPFAESASDGTSIHPVIGAQTGLPSVFRYEDADFQLEGWSPDTTSVARMDGIR